MDQAVENTDREIYRETGEFNSPKITVTRGGGIGIEVGGHVIVASLRDWYHYGFFGRRVYTKRPSDFPDQKPVDATPP